MKNQYENSKQIKAKKVLLINPDPQPRELPPLSLCYLAENLKLAGHNPQILDMGISKEINLNGIDFIGITATTLIYPEAKKIITEIKRLNSKIPIIIGGMHPSVMPEFVINDSGADAVVVGEGEEVMVSIVNGEIPPKGIIKAKIIESIDSIPFPRYEGYIDLNKYFNSKSTGRTKWSLPNRSIAIMGIRGCPFNCAFCASHVLFARKIRCRSIENITGELDYLIAKHHIQGVFFYDDTLTLNKDWMKDLCKVLKERKLKWICNTRVDTVDEPLLKIMKESGCKYISYGIESGSNRVLKDIIHKGITIEQVEQTLKLTKKEGIGLINCWMFGLPGETEEDLKLTLSAVKRLPGDAAEFSIFIPLPGTELAKDLDWSKYSADKNPYHIKSPVHSLAFAETIRQYHHKAIMAFYFSPKYIIKKIGLIFHPQRFYFALKSMLKLLKDSYKNE